MACLDTPQSPGFLRNIYCMVYDPLQQRLVSSPPLVVSLIRVDSLGVFQGPLIALSSPPSPLFPYGSVRVVVPGVGSFYTDLKISTVSVDLRELLEGTRRVPEDKHVL